MSKCSATYETCQGSFSYPLETTLRFFAKFRLSIERNQYLGQSLFVLLTSNAIWLGNNQKQVCL